MISSIQSYFAGKAASYFVNAEADAKDALVIMETVKHHESPVHSDSYRVKKIITLWNNDSESLSLVSYSLYFHNGFTDHVYARTVARMVGFRLPQSRYYPNATIQPTDFFLPWLEIFFRYPKKLRQFCDVHMLPLPKSSRKNILEITKKMQEINIEINITTINDLLQGKETPKTQALFTLSKAATIQQVFLDSARQTQQAAIFWDRVFVQLIKLRMRFIF